MPHSYLDFHSLIAVGAKMLYEMLSESVSYAAGPPYPIDREHANANGMGIIPTQEDFREWASIKAVQPYQSGEWDLFQSISTAETHSNMRNAERKSSEPLSCLFDNEWIRLTQCLDPYRELPFKRSPYTLGSMTGLFAGRVGVRLSHRLACVFQLIYISRFLGSRTRAFSDVRPGTDHARPYCV